ncbi:unnamed protein product [Prorocentrum cordatum]|uniref:EF-hand domain-containing protein n=1 Tax=Prorocentrum cordatum TaxID=2364126 RepID=A0ABN9VMB1_9DINO|nr:unnamed protein product [Polarella glacialis]
MADRPPDAAVLAPRGSTEAPPPADCDLGPLLERARAAHEREVGRLREEVRRLRAELAGAARGERAAPPRARGEPRPCPSEPSPRSSSEVCPTFTEREPVEDHVAAPPEGSRASTKNSEPMTYEPGPSMGLRRKGRDTVREEQLLAGRGCVWRLVTSTSFEVTIGVAIIANGVLMAAEAQYAGLRLAHDVGHESADGGSAQEWPHASETFDILQWLFGVIFLIEVLLKIVGLRFEFVCDAWNWVDLVIVVMWLYSLMGQLAVNAQFLRLARLVRMLRLLRIIRFMQSHLTESLFLMSTALAGSIFTTTWAFLLFIIVHAMLALFISQTLSEFYFASEPSRHEGHLEVFEFFGSFSRAFLTMFEITFDGWSLGVRALVDNVSEIFIIYAVLHKVLIGFAAVGVLGAVFIQETFESAQMDDNLVVRQQHRKERLHSKNMQRLFMDADLDGNGSVDLGEWLSICNDSWVQVWLRAQDIDEMLAYCSNFWMMATGSSLRTSSSMAWPR